MNSRRKKQICVLAYTKYSIDTRIRREAETIAETMEYDVTILAPKEGKTARRYPLENVEVMELVAGRYRGKSNLRLFWSYLLFLCSAFFACTGLFFKRGIDIVHVHNMPNVLVFAAIVPRLFGRKIILDVHDTMPETYRAKCEDSSEFIFRLLSLEEALCAAFVHKIICVNGPQSEAMIKRGVPSHKIDIIMNVPQEKVLNSTYDSQDTLIDPGAFNLVYHGTIARRLGVDLAIRAMEKIVPRIPNAALYIYGIDNDSDECASLVDDLGIGSHVHFREPMPLYQLVPILRQMDMGVVSNRKSVAAELMLPVKLLEYITLNIPVVAPRLKTIRHYFADDMVHYFDPEDVDSLADTIYDAYLHDSKRKAYAERARNHIRQHEWHRYERTLTTLYKTLSQ
jgi:glycosyltransferase involved in cell wall biosynthesis